MKRGAFELHYKAVSEALNSLNWLMVEPTPREIIAAQLEAADYNLNKSTAPPLCVAVRPLCVFKRGRERVS